MTTLADDLVPDELWAIVAPLLPAPPRLPYGGRHRAIPNRACFAEFWRALVNVALIGGRSVRRRWICCHLDS